MKLKSGKTTNFIHYLKTNLMQDKVFIEETKSIGTVSMRPPFFMTAPEMPKAKKSSIPEVNTEMKAKVLESGCSERKFQAMLAYKDMLIKQNPHITLRKLKSKILSKFNIELI